jgi:hypothetical protein
LSRARRPTRGIEIKRSQKTSRISQISDIDISGVVGLADLLHPPYLHFLSLT